MRVRRRVRGPSLRVASALVVCSLVLAGCGGGDDDEDGEDQATSAVAEVPETWPLTGLPVEGDASAAKRHPVMVLKMDNTPPSAPQLGLGDADLVVEELVEGGSTRLAAFFYSTIPGDVGPVRSMRASDIGIVSPVDGVMVTSGAAAVTIERIRDAGIEFFSDGSEGFFRDNGRSAPYNLFTDLSETVKQARGEQARPADYLPWGEAADLPAGQPARTLAARFSSGHTTSWTFAGGRYSIDDSYAAEGEGFPADTVLVLRVRVGDAGYRDPAGNPVPETRLEGRGAALLFHGGRLVRGTWSKSGLDQPIALETQAGELTVPVGRTWIELVPVDGGDVTFAR